jgi:Rrf2 family transcriptional regulator, cysteine metabolism repressor
MITINRQTEYALFLINYLKNGKNPVSLKEVCRHSGLSDRFMAKVAVSLKKEKILGSREGAGGGYWLTADPKKTSLWKIFEIFERNRRIVSCLSGQECIRRCRLKSFWKKMEADFSGRIKKINLSEIID